MRTAFMVIGAAVLVAGASLIALAPYYTQTGFYRVELKYAFNSSSLISNPSFLYSQYSGYADTGDLVAIMGAIIAPVGAALLAYGLSGSKTEEKEKQVGSATEPMQA